MWNEANACIVECIELCQTLNFQALSLNTNVLGKFENSQGTEPALCLEPFNYFF